MRKGTFFFVSWTRYGIWIGPPAPAEPRGPRKNVKSVRLPHSKCEVKCKPKLSGFEAFRNTLFAQPLTVDMSFLLSCPVLPSLQKPRGGLKHHGSEGRTGSVSGSLSSQAKTHRNRRQRQRYKCPLSGADSRVFFHAYNLWLLFMAHVTTGF